MTRPDPAREIRMTGLRVLRGANFWSARPMTRLDVAVGSYDDISSAEVPGFTEALAQALPELTEHRCSIGERGGFLTRLRQGTYAPHITEHVALALQERIGHDVAYGKTRGGDVPGEYTVVFEHRHSIVGLRAAALALEIVQRAFAGTPVTADHADAELRSLAASPDAAPLRHRVLCGITGGGPRHATRSEMLRRGVAAQGLIVDVAPSFILQAGLPFSRAEMAIVLDAEPVDVPERYQDPERARTLTSVIADAVPRGGMVIAPAAEREIGRYARERGCRVSVFAIDGAMPVRAEPEAHAVASLEGERIVLRCRDSVTDGGPLHDGIPAAAQVAAALALFTLQELEPELLVTHGADA